ncbi:MAG: hypothetical protein ACM3SW_16450 [Actinomycetota bacterium]
MKKIRNAVVFAIYMLSAVFWAQHSSAQAQRPLKVEPMPMPLNRQVTADDHLHMLTQQLNLTKPQQARVRPILKRYIQQRHAIMMSNKLSADAKSNKLQSSEQTMHAKVRRLLTAEQKETFDQIMGPPPAEVRHHSEHVRHRARPKTASAQK